MRGGAKMAGEAKQAGLAAAVMHVQQHSAPNLAIGADARPMRLSAPPMSAVLQRMGADPRGLSRADIAVLQRTVGNAATARMMARPVSETSRPRHGLPDPLKAGIQHLAQLSMDDVRVHYNSSEPAKVDAHAFAQGRDIHLAPGMERHLAHEAWHVVRQTRGAVRPTLQLGGAAINDDARLEAEADSMGARAMRQTEPPSRHGDPASSIRAGTGSGNVLQRMVRTGGGKTKVAEADYLNGAKQNIGAKIRVSALIADQVKRVFADVAELENYADGKIDHIGDVKTGSAGTYWYSLPEHKLTVLGEQHKSTEGNVEDVVLGLHTSRFMYEPYNEMAKVKGLDIPYAGTQSKIDTADKGQRTAALRDKNFNPALENIVIKALTGAAIVRNGFIRDPQQMLRKTQILKWGSRASTSSYSYGDRAAFYISAAIQLAEDVSSHDFKVVDPNEIPLITSGRDLKSFYEKNKSALNKIKEEKNKDELIGILELTKKLNIDLKMLEEFTVILHEYGTRYIEQLGKEIGSNNLSKAGGTLFAKKDVTLEELSPVREMIMWSKIKAALKSGYLLVGMGEAHRKNLKPELDKQQHIAHAKVDEDLKEQKKKIENDWTA